MIRAFRSAGSRFFAVDGLFLAAGLAFSSLVCLIPLVLLSVSAVGFVLSGERAAHEVVEQITRNFPVYRREISRALLALVETRRVSGLVGTVILVLFSTQLFSAARLVMHRVLGVRGGGFLGNFARDAFMVTVLSVFLFVSTAASWIALNFQSRPRKAVCGCFAAMRVRKCASLQPTSKTTLSSEVRPMRARKNSRHCPRC